jgi:hypothetical protein
MLEVRAPAKPKAKKKKTAAKKVKTAGR